MITSRKELKFYLKADEIMNEQVFPQGFIKRLLLPNPIQKFMRCMRKLEYYDYKRKYSFLYIPIFLWYKASYNRLSIKNGFDIPINSLGYGCRIGHRCGIIISGSTKIGNYCCLYRCSCADGSPKNIGNHVFIGTNVVITKKVTIADGCSISAMSLVNKDFCTENTLVGGIPARSLKPSRPWTEEQPYKSEFERCEALKKEMSLDI